MRFLELVLQNFGPYLGRHEINLSPERDGKLYPIILLGGMNGGGKTTLMDAIRLAFYGQRAQCSTRRNLSYGDFLNQCVHRNAKALEETVVELSFEHIRDNVPVVFRIQRTWTKSKKKGKDRLRISIDKWLDDALTKTWDEWIENILPLGISNLFLFDGEQVKELAELDKPPSQVVDAIQSLLGLELAERLAVDLEILVNRKRKALASAQERANLEEIEQELGRLKESRDRAIQDLEELQAQLERDREQYQIASDRFITEGGKIAAERSRLEHQIQAFGSALEAHRQQLRELAAELLPIALISPLLEQARQQGEKELKQHKAIAARDVVQTRDRRLLDYLADLSLSAAKVKKIKSFLEQENQELDRDIDPEASFWLNVTDETLDGCIGVLDDRLPRQVQQAREQREGLEQVEAEIDSTERQLQAAASPEAYQQLEKALKQAQGAMAQAQTAYEAKRQQSEQLDGAIARTKKELERYSEQSLDRKSNEHLIQSAAKVQKTLQLFRERLTLKKLNKLEVEVTECFRYLLHKSDLVHRVAIDAHNFSLSLYDPKGQPIPKHRLSAGEKQLLAIAFLWGLARVSGRNLPVAIDTPLGRLDSSHRSNLVERYFPSASSQTILLSTDTEIGEKEVEQLRTADAIAREYILKYDPKRGQTTVEPGYFW
ncbi:DNA sulfur modification protein DndD [Lusitaniella coriacea]|uniref:DNA sulfur modification protein DndD n=1 Tax=Lusitaniella coriacea TaxID=1983105 RepID=UPI003CF4E8A1